MARILRYCKIRSGVVSINGNKSFSQEGTLEEFTDTAYAHFVLGYPRYFKMEPMARLALLAASCLLPGEKEVDPEKVAVILSNSSSSLDTDRRYFESAKKAASPALFVYTLPNIAIGELCIRFGWKGENAFFVFDAFDADFMCSYTSNLFQSDIADLCIGGWVDVLGEQYDVFLYLAEKEPVSGGYELTASTLNDLYQ